MLSAPTVLPTPGPDPDYNTPDNHFNMENAPQQFVYGFDQDVTVAPDALTVTNLTSGNVFTDFTESGTSDSHTWSVNAAGSYGETYALLQGNYEANLNSDFVTNGNREKLNGGVDDITSSFYLPGDANHDRVVNADDYFYIDSGTPQNPQPQGFHNGDFNYDGVINSDDYFVIDSTAGTVLPPPPTEPNTVTATACRDAAAWI